ncbi:MAG TPA: extracellular solute-binding protein [Thermomicrobiales bacterium]|nr:extracellular solute-binding protein [Thermomicrobiales bacterium]
MSDRSSFRMNRRALVGSALAGTAALSVVGRPSRAFAAPAYLRQGGDVTLEVWGGVPAENGPQELVDAFMAANPSIKVNYTRYVNDDTGNTQLDTALQGGTPIDVFFTYAVTRLGQRIKAGAAVDLTPYVTADSDINAWVTETDGIFTSDGTYFSLPTTQEPNFVFVNKDKLEAAGATLPEAGWTIDEFLTLSETLTKDGAFGAYIPPDSARMQLGPDYWYKEGATESNFDDPAFRENIQRHRDMIDNGTAFPWTDVLAQNLRAYAQTPFLTEQTMLWLNSSYSLRFISDKEQYPHEFVTTFAPSPVPAGVDNPWNGGGINNWLQMKEGTANPDAAWTLIRFWLVEGAQYMLKAGKIPAFPGTDENTVVEGILGPDREELYDVEAYRTVVFDPGIRLVTDTITTGSAEIAKIVEGLSDRCLIGEIEVDEWVSEAKSQADAAIAGAS